MIFIDQEKYKDFIGVYKITNIVTNIFYIGSTIIGTSNRNFRVRFNEHSKDLKNNRHSNNKLQNSFNKHGSENFTFEVLEIVENQEFCIPREQFYLDTLLFAQEYIRKEDNKFLKLSFNLNPTAKNSLGHRHSKESKKLMSKSKIKLYEDHPEKREKAKEKTLKFYKDNPNARKEHSEKLVKFYEDRPEVKIKSSQTAIEYLLNHPEIREYNRQCALNKPIFECKCGKKIKGKGNFDRHVKSCNGTLKVIKRSEESRELSRRKANDYLLFTCKCGREIKGKGGLVRHQNSCKIFFENEKN